MTATKRSSRNKWHFLFCN